MKAVELFKAKIKSQVTELSAEEMQQAEFKCCMWVQQEADKEDYEHLNAGEALPKSSRLLKLDPYYDRTDQVIRVGGRLQFADIPEETKHQIILPHGHSEVAKMILDVHKQMLHAGPETLLSTLRQRIWITQGRREKKTENVSFAKDNALALVARRWDHYPKKELRPHHRFETSVQTLLGPYT